MELDRRIVEGKRPLTCFDIEEAKKYIGEECYFTSKFENLSKVTCTTLHNVDDGPVPFQCFDDDGIFCYDCFILPCEWVKEHENKYRPFSLNEFVNQYSLGEEVIVRHKEDKNIKHKLFTEFGENNDAVRLGSHYYTLQDLYDRYELYTGDGWKPFGIEIHK